MIARPPIEPSRAAVRAAKATASSPHALINLVRLVKALEADDDEVEASSGGSRQRAQVHGPGDQAEGQNMEYATALLDALSSGNEQSSSTSTTLEELRRSLDNTREGMHASIQSSTRLSSSKPIDTSKAMHESSNGAGVGNQPVASGAAVEVPAIAPVVRRRRKAPTLDEYLRQRAREDLASDDSRLLPLKSAPVAGQGDTSESSRDKLLGGASGGLGSAQLHEELGGQLADMSHRLKLNALHFAKSLEDEKDLLDIGQDVLEKNLAGTRSSKKDLSTVSSKTRGTTCMTLGIVLLVMVLFIWTYMLIRFT